VAEIVFNIYRLAGTRPVTGVAQFTAPVNNIFLTHLLLQLLDYAAKAPQLFWSAVAELPLFFRHAPQSSDGADSLPVLRRRNKFRLIKAEATRFSTPHANFAIRKKLNLEYR
jgi:hypothetical protein